MITLGYIFEDTSENNICFKNNRDIIFKSINMYYSILKDTNNNIIIKYCLLSIKNIIPSMEEIISSNDSGILFFNLIRNFMMNNDVEICSSRIAIFSQLISQNFLY